MAFGHVAVAAEQLGVGVRAVVVEDLLASPDGAEGCDGELVFAVVDVCLCKH